MDVLVGIVSSQEVTNLALTLIHFIWQGALIAACLWLALLCIPRNSFKLRYRSAVFALVLSVASPVATYSFLSQYPSIGQVNLAHVSEFKDSVANSMDSSVSEFATLAAESSNAETPMTLASRADYLRYVLLVWLMGCLVMTFKFVLDLNRTFKLTREGVAKVSNRVESLVNNLSTKYQLKRRITILKSRKVNVPVVIGWLRPVILLPIAITIGLETKHLELIIAHELAHIKRMDFAVNLFQSLVQICLFYHPVIYWINKVIRDEREYICDQLALEVLGNDESAKINLAKALLGTEELREGNLSLVAVAASGGMLKHRISHILDSQYKPATSFKSLFLGGMVSLFSFAAFSTTFELNDTNVVTAQTLELDDKIGIKPANSLNIKDQLAVVATKRDNSKTKELIENEVFESAITDDKIGNKTAITTKSDQIEQTNSSKSKLSKDKRLFNVPLDSLKVHADNRLSLAKNAAVRANNNVLENKQTNNKPKPSLKSGDEIAKLKPAAIQPAVVNSELYRELSSKALTDQYLIPAAAVSDKSRLLKTAALDLQSISSFKEPKAIFTPYPKYPRRAWDKMINQTVRVNFNITKAGVVGDINIMENADRDFSREIRRKLGSWKYEPAVKQGEKVAYSTSLEFVFKAPQKEPIIPISTGTRIRRR